MRNKKLMDNPLITRKDVSDALLDMLRPLEENFSQYGLRYGSGTALYGDFIGEIEALARPLWGIIPLLAGQGTYPCFDKYLSKIIEGVDPDSESYWGILPHQDQRMVEMTAIALGMIMAKKHIRDCLADSQKDNLYNWLNQINEHEIYPNNWLFFRVLINTAFILCDRKHDEKRMKEDLAAIDAMYIGDGWYFDGNPSQIDWYIPFAMHFYGLIYASYASFDAKYPKLFKERAIEFSKTFPAFFAETGEAVPFGRSMIYRFAQSAFFGALALADVKVLPWGEARHLALQNLRHWMRQNIFSDNGELTVGYYYPNLNMAEGYNAFGSPYWALKAFIMLAVPENHPFWTDGEQSPHIKSHIALPQARGIIQRDAAQSQFFVAGQYAPPWISHSQAKYEKFVYSSYFGFSVPKSPIGLSQGAFDNALAVCENNDDFYRMRCGAEEYRVNDEYLYIKWKPWSDVKIESYIIPLFPWHVRIHIVNAGRKLTLADGGFAIDRQDKHRIVAEIDSCAVIRENCMSGIVGLSGGQEPLLVQAETATNLMTPLTFIPTLTSKILSGSHVLISAVLGAVGKSPECAWKEPPTSNILDEAITLCYSKIQRKIQISNLSRFEN